MCIFVKIRLTRLFSNRIIMLFDTSLYMFILPNSKIWHILQMMLFSSEVSHFDVYALSIDITSFTETYWEWFGKNKVTVLVAIHSMHKMIM